MISHIKTNAYKYALIIATAALIGSLYFSEVLGYAPCTLCWYQRIALYPLVPLFAIGIQTRDKNVGLYAWPLVIFGLIVSVYQNLLYYGIIQEVVRTCQVGVSCSVEYLQLFGFMDIPLMALISLIGIALLLVVARKQTSNE
jgi:disulfide bond formation protein DsbB